jgi:hypothetical protein
MKLPYVGAMVHYVAFGTPGGEYKPGSCRPAVITEINDQESGNVKATIFQTEGQFTKQALPLQYVPYKPGTWHPLEACVRWEQGKKQEAEEIERRLFGEPDSGKRLNEDDNK